MLFTLNEVIEATGGVLVNAGPDTAVTAVSIDSRDIAPGALFVAIAGDRFDGHDFVSAAIAEGACAAVVSRDRHAGLDQALPLVVVDDAFEGLRALARHSRARSRARIVAVTGSAGKTSTKDALRTIFSASGATHASVKSFNNHWGVPLTLSRMPEDAAFGVFEIGMNHAGEITPLAAMVRPHVALVTSIGEAHLEHLGSVAAIADAKGEIFSGLEPGGVAVINADHAHLDRLAGHARAAGATVVTYGLGANAGYRISPEAGGESGISGRVLGPDLDCVVAVPSYGVHSLVNAVGALLAARASGVMPEAAIAALAGHRAGAGRGEVVTLGPSGNPLVLIDESYNANPSSMRAALSVFAGLPQTGRKVLVLGEMRELGSQGAQLHRELADAVVASGAEMVFLVGAEMVHLQGALAPGRVQRLCRTTQEISLEILDSLAYGDVVMVKGSNGVRLGQLVDAIKARFASRVQP